MRAKVYIGTSGWVYKDWGESFYPEDLKPKDQLPFFAKHFQTVEINNSFYHIPRKSAVKGWHDTTPDDFVFAIKLNNYLTHTKRLILDDKSRERLHLFMRVMQQLGKKGKALLVQLPPYFKADLERLDAFLYELAATVPAGQKVFCEFRHPSWLADDTYKLLRRHRAGFVIPTYPGGFKDDYPVTSSAVYIRYHAAARRWNYSERELNKWAGYISRLQDTHGVREIYVYFNNDQSAHAIANARYLGQKLAGTLAAAR